MITERDLIQAIRECESEPHTQSKMAKLADFYIIYDHLFGDNSEGANYRYNDEYSREPATVEKIIEEQGDTEFLQAANGKSASGVLQILDELMEATKVLHPRMYDQVISRLKDL